MRSALRCACVTLAALVAGGVVAVGVSSCGAGRGGARMVAEAEEVHVRMTEFALAPSHIHARAGVIELFARNDGAKDHVLAVQTSDGEVARTKRLAPGKSGSVKVDFRPGRYGMYDPLDAYRRRGMAGIVAVAPRTTTVARTVTQTRTVTQPTVVTVPQVKERTIIRTVTRTVTVARPRRP
ncbi:MAG: cupredoxin domain-containing protein [Solirubrobacteraceae bacterium]|jgi:plastocyanin